MGCEGGTLPIVTTPGRRCPRKSGVGPQTLGKLDRGKHNSESTATAGGVERVTGSLVRAATEQQVYTQFHCEITRAEYPTRNNQHI